MKEGQENQYSSIPLPFFYNMPNYKPAGSYVNTTVLLVLFIYFLLFRILLLIYFVAYHYNSGSFFFFKKSKILRELLLQIQNNNTPITISTITLWMRGTTVGQEPFLPWSPTQETFDRAFSRLREQLVYVQQALWDSRNYKPTNNHGL